MLLRNSAIIAKYMVKNHIINPILKKSKAALAAALIVIVVIACTAALVAVFTEEPNSGGESEENSADFVDALRQGLLALGINKYTATEALSLMFLAVILLAIAKGHSALVAMDEAEYELLLSQPIDMGTYVLSKVMFQVAQSMLFGIVYLFYAILAYDLSGGNLAKAVMFPVALILLLVFFSLVTDLIPAVKIALGDKARFLEIAAYAYTAVGVLHSALLLRPSPLLTAPFKAMAESIVMCATRTETWDYVTLRLAASAAIVACMALALIRVSNRLHPEAVKPLPAMVRKSRLLKRESMPVYSPRPETAVMRVVLVQKVLSLRHARNVALGLVFACVLGFALSEYLVPRLGLEEDLISYILFFAVPMLLAEAVTFWVATTLSEDLLPLWVYRVYSSDLSPLALSLITKYTVYFTETLIVVAAFKYVLTGDPVHLALPVIALPLNVVVSFATLASLTYLSSKRRVVRMAPSGIYVLESMAVTVVFLIVFVPVAALQALFDALTKEATLWPVATTCSVMAVLSPVLAWILSKALASIMESLELRT